jgi:hypothetical protein
LSQLLELRFIRQTTSRTRVAILPGCQNNETNGSNETNERNRIMARPESKTITLTQPAPIVEEPVPELLGRRKRPEVGQFRLLVDRQTKASFATYEAAEKAAMAIKTGHPIVNVVVYDAKEGVNSVIELAKS